MTLSHATQSGRHSLVERAQDLYQTPAVATEALLRAEFLPKRIWEPAAGRGAITRVLEAAGHEVLAEDLIDYGVRGQYTSDFLFARKAPPGYTAIVTNPPYQIAATFVRKSLELVPRVVMLLRLAFLESASRSDILDGGQLQRVHVFRNRLPMMHRDSWNGPKSTSAVPFAWYVWNRDYHGPTQLRRISWKKTPSRPSASSS